MHVSIIENHSISRIGIRELIRECFKRTTFSEETHDLTDSGLLSLQSSDLVFLGLESHGSVNLMTWEKIREIRKAVPTIIYCSQIKYFELIKLLKQGAKGILMSHSEQEFSQCINAVLEGQRYICREALLIIAERAILIEGNSNSVLSTREMTIAEYLKDGHSTGYIAKTLNLPLPAISLTKGKIFEKLGIENVLQLEEVMDSGYVIVA